MTAHAKPCPGLDQPAATFKKSFGDQSVNLPSDAWPLLTRSTVAISDGPAAIAAAFKSDGYVVVTGVLASGEVTQALDELWTSPNLLGCSTSIVRKDPRTWIPDLGWPQSSLSAKGFLDSKSQHQDEWCWRIRQHPNLIAAFEAVWDGEIALKGKQLIATLDTWGVMRPTRDVKCPDSTCVDKPEWRTQSRWLHWDYNPWTEQGLTRIQGLVALTEHTATSGGFACIPRFHERLTAWAQANPMGSFEGATAYAGDGNPLLAPSSDPIQKEICKIAMPAGSLLLWDSRLPHQNFPNSDDQFRVVQYVMFHPQNKEEVAERRKALLSSIDAGFAHNPEGRASFFPHGLTAQGCAIVGLSQEDTMLPPPSEKNLEALQLLHSALSCENSGDHTEAIQLFKKAFKKNPKLEMAWQLHLS